jgi:hypothetical protein
VIKHLKQADIDAVPHSNWYRYVLECGHVVYTRIRLKLPKSYMEHYIKCPRPVSNQHQHKSALLWQAVTKMEAVSDEHVSMVSNGNAFVLSERVLRTDGSRYKDGQRITIPSGNPFPYKLPLSERD